MSEELPRGWEWIGLGELFDFRYGKGLPQEKRNPKGPIKVYGSNGVVGVHDSAVTKGPTIIVGRKGSVGEVHLSSQRCWPIDTTYFIDDFPAELPPSYWALQLKSLRLGQQEKSSAIPGISRDDIYAVQVPLPPLAEQQRIVAKLEKLLAKVDACQRRLAKIPILLKRFRQSVLAAACSGRLTAVWREEKARSECGAVSPEPTQTVREKMMPCVGAYEIPDDWQWTKFRTLVATIRGGSTVPPQNDPTDYPILRSSSVRPSAINYADLRFLSLEQSQNSDDYLSDGDLLFTRLSGSLEYLANCAMVRALAGRRIQYPDRIFCAKLINPAHAPYLELCFANPVLRSELTEGAKSSAGHQRLSITDITGQRIPLPPLVEQQEILRRVEALFALADRIGARYAKAQARVDQLTPSLLARAFRGELVSQDPDDEPATALLERIQSVQKREGRKPGK